LAIEKVSLIGPLMRCFSLMNYWADPFVTGQLFDLFVMFFVPSNTSTKTRLFCSALLPDNSQIPQMHRYPLSHTHSLALYPHLSTIREGEPHEKNMEELRVFVMGTIISECIVGSQQSALALTTIEFLRSLFQLLPKGSPHYYEVSLVLP